MLDRSWHTHQINLWIALSRFEPTFSNTLSELGYECDVIEDRLYIHDGDGNDIICPDVILTSDVDEHSLVIDCKSEEVDSDQLERYLRLYDREEQLVVQGLVREIDSETLSIDTVLSSFSNLSEKPIQNEFSIVHFDLAPYSGLSIWNAEEYQFNSESVSESFPINVHPEQPLPTGHYPYDIYEGDKEAMISIVLSTIISLTMKEGEFSIEDILKQSHPYWNTLGENKKSELYDRVEIIFHELRRLGLDDYIEKIAGTEGREWQRTSKTIQAINRRTDFYVSRVIDELPQARLDHDAWSTQSFSNGSGSASGED